MIRIAIIVAACALGASTAYAAFGIHQVGSATANPQGFLCDNTGGGSCNASTGYLLTPSGIRLVAR